MGYQRYNGKEAKRKRDTKAKLHTTNGIRTKKVVIGSGKKARGKK